MNAIYTLKVIQAHELSSIQTMDTYTKERFLAHATVTTGDARFTLLTVHDVLYSIRNDEGLDDVREELLYILGESGLESANDHIDGSENIELGSMLYINMEYL